jgi:hypothetical protein
VTRPTRLRKWPGPLGTYSLRTKNWGKASASSGGGGRPGSSDCRHLGVAGRVQGVGQQTGFGAVEGRELTRGACLRQRGSVVGEEGWQTEVVVAGGVVVVGEVLLGGVKLRVGSRGARNGRRSPAPGRCSWRQGTR